MSDASGGYVCTPYIHNHDSVELKDKWIESDGIGDMFFVAATFSPESRPYFSSSANHYLLAKFKDAGALVDMERYKQEKTAFIFSIDEDLFEREPQENTNFVSMYYLEYGGHDEDISEIASVVARHEKIGKAGVGHMDLCSTIEQRFVFPYSAHIIVLEVSSVKSHQSVNKYCEKTRRDVIRKGITMTNLVNLSILERLK